MLMSTEYESFMNVQCESPIGEEETNNQNECMPLNNTHLFNCSITEEVKEEPSIFFFSITNLIEYLL